MSALKLYCMAFFAYVVLQGSALLGTETFRKYEMDYDDDESVRDKLQKTATILSSGAQRIIASFDPKLADPLFDYAVRAILQISWKGLARSFQERVMCAC